MSMFELFGRNDTIWVIGLSRKTISILEKNGLFTIDQLNKKGIDEIGKIKGIGSDRLNEISQILNEEKGE